MDFKSVSNTRDRITWYVGINPAFNPFGKNIMTNDEVRNKEYDNIIQALKKSNGKVFGTGGAAELLDIKPTTLASKIKRLGIDKNAFRE